jgi:hypothetical protein
MVELRNPAHGLHPAVLSERWLAAALDALVARSPVCIELRAPIEGVEPDDLLHRRIAMDTERKEGSL